jgi:hypothetical protein
MKKGPTFPLKTGAILVSDISRRSFEFAIIAWMYIL